MMIPLLKAITFHVRETYTVRSIPESLRTSFCI
jgi:hypothetical protein